MRATDYKYRKVLAGMIFFISLFLFENLNAQMTFHLAGSFVCMENPIIILKAKEPGAKIPPAKWKKITEENRLKRIKIHLTPKKTEVIGREESKWLKSDSGNSVQKLRLAHLKRNFSNNSQ
jgi:hypothetical protein